MTLIICIRCSRRCRLQYEASGLATLMTDEAWQRKAFDEALRPCSFFSHG